jgi:hypothetical protein
MVENVLDVVWHGRFPGMVLSGTSVELVSGFQSTFRESTYWKIEVVNESCAMAQKPMDTLNDFVNCQVGMGQHVEENLRFLFK